MYFNLALRNVKKSIKDYAIYFLTLTFGICIFYVFNSLSSQQAMLILNASQHEILDALNQLMGYVSIFISIILGFLVVYANGFLMKRRKKEMGVYTMLGMDKSKVSTVLMTETFLIGLISLIVGLVCGIFLSQGLSVVTAKLFRVDMSGFRFVFSSSALMKTAIYFAIIFLVVMLFNLITVSRQKAITLLYSEKKNQKLLVRNLAVTVIIFLLSIACIGGGYYMILKNGMWVIDRKFFTAIILGSVGTLLFFMSLSGFLLKLVKSVKGIYYKGLNMFTMRQLNSNINTAFISISMICLMLFFTILILSTGLGISHTINSNIEYGTPYDVTYYAYNERYTDAYFKQDLPKLYEESVEQMIPLHYYIHEESTLGTLIPPNSFPFPGADEQPLFFIKESEFNRAMEAQNRETLNLKDDQFLLLCDYALVQDKLDKAFKESGQITIDGKPFYSIEKKTQQIPLGTTSMPMNVGTLVVKDSVVEQFTLGHAEYSYLLKEGVDDAAFDQTIRDYYTEHPTSPDEDGVEYSIITEEGMVTQDVPSLPYPYHMAMTKTDVKESSLGLSVMATYICLYIGIVFLITAAAVLALKQLSDASDNVQRYTLLRKIGAEPKMINHAILIQVAIYFLLPFALALVHSFVGLKVTTEFVQMFGRMDITKNLIFTTLFFAVIYGTYFLGTYLGCKTMNSERFHRN